MFDLQVIFVEDILDLTKVDYFQRTDVPRSLDIIGKKLNRATRVMINDLESPEFMILSSTRIIAQIPINQAKSQIRRVLVLADVPTPGERSILHFEFGRSFKALQGIERLVQFYAKILVQSPGSDVFHPDRGGGLKRLVGRNVDSNTGTALQADVVAAINKARDQVLRIQASNPRIPVDERLRSAAPEAVGFNPSTTTLSAKIRIQAVSGRQAVSNLTL